MLDDERVCSRHEVKIEKAEVKEGKREKRMKKE